MNLLAVESADGAASVAWQQDGQAVQCVRNPQMQDSLSWFMVEVAKLREQVFSDWQQLDALVCCVGPGGFTGVRVAVGYVQGLALASGLPCLAVNSLDAMAANVELDRVAGQGHLWLALDARMDELYMAPYLLQQNELRRCGELELVSQNDAAELIAAHHQVAGPGFEACADMFGQRLLEGVRLDAGGVLLAARKMGLDQAVAAAELQPIYLRNQVAKTLEERGLV